VKKRRDNISPDEVFAATREPLGAVAMVYGLLLSGDEDVRAKQLN